MSAMFISVLLSADDMPSLLNEIGLFGVAGLTDAILAAASTCASRYAGDAPP